jgi:cysteinyl-tRNA synthetase
MLIARHEPDLHHYPLHYLLINSAGRFLSFSSVRQVAKPAVHTPREEQDMTDIKLHNTKTRSKEVFTPIDAQNVRMYVCGPTVYDRAHLGNARPVVVFDVLNRLLRHVYGDDHVTYVRNFTDVDDKINTRAARSGRSIGEITEETIGWFLEDMGALGALQPDHMPRATEFVPQMVVMIEDLIAKGHAYAAEGHVLFAVESYAKYGALSGRSIDDMIAGARVEVAPYKRNPLDFVLWKPSTDDLPGWESPWGRGRPGWHIECSAMAYELLGASFDIHGGGNDLMFPHHENELAQSCCAHPDSGFANVWMHNEMLQVEGKKMSKSLGNFFTVRDLLDQGVPGEVIRFVFLSTHYRKPMDWTEAKARQFQTELQKWSYWIMDFKNTQTPPSIELIESLADDLNTPKAITHLRALYSSGAYEQLAADAKFLNLWNGQSASEITMIYTHNTFDEQWIKLLMIDVLRRIDMARNEKKYDISDKLKAELTDAGIKLQFGKHSTTYDLTPDFDPSKLEALR